MEPTVLSRLVLARFNLLGPTRSTVPVWRPCYVICEISLRSLRRGARRQTSGRGSLILRTAEPENRQENDSQKSQTDPEARTFAKAFRQIDAENYADNKIH